MRHLTPYRHMSKHKEKYFGGREHARYKAYIRERNKQLFAALENGMTYDEASELFLIEVSNIRSKYKLHRKRFHPEFMGIIPEWQKARDHENEKLHQQWIQEQLVDE